MTEHEGAVTFKGNPLTLVGDLPEVGEPVPDVALVTGDLEEVTVASFRGSPLIVASVPSLDTSVCSTETRRFNEEAGKLGSVQVLTVSMDLPFAQKRWCGAEGIEHVVTASDHRGAAFGQAWGVLIQDLRLLARAVFVVDSGGVLRYKQLVAEMTEEPDYDLVLAAACDLT
ncbi:MAG: thiol peroxidase [Phycisphaerae bacterium]